MDIRTYELAPVHGLPEVSTVNPTFRWGSWWAASGTVPPTPPTGPMNEKRTYVECTCRPIRESPCHCHPAAVNNRATVGEVGGDHVFHGDAHCFVDGDLVVAASSRTVSE
jgi:hypothetical protein